VPSALDPVGNAKAFEAILQSGSFMLPSFAEFRPTDVHKAAKICGSASRLLAVGYEADCVTVLTKLSVRRF
jgi:hypothetical protein